MVAVELREDRVGDALRQRVARLDGLAAMPAEVAFATDDRSVVVVESGAVLRWIPATGAVTRGARTIPPASTHVALSPDRGRLAFDATTRSLRVVDLDGAPGLPEVAVARSYESISAVAFSPTGKILAMGTYDGTLSLVIPGDQAPTRTVTHPKSGVGALAFSPDGRSIASTWRDGALRVHDVARATEIRRVDAPGATGVAVSPAVVAWSAPDRAVRISPNRGDAAVTLGFAAARDAGYAMTSDAVELLGSEAEAAAALLVCRAGALTFPLELCRERHESPGLVARVLAGEPAAADP